MTNFWQDKKVIVIGGAGFVGYHLVKSLKNHCDNIVVTMNKKRNERDKIEGVTYIVSDAKHLNGCKEIFREADIVINLAAKVAGVQYNQNNNLAMLAENLPLQVNPVLAASLVKVPYFVQMSSVCVYGNGETAPSKDDLMAEDMEKPTQANYGYTLSKRVGEMALLQANIEKKLIVRPTNIYGPRDDFSEKSHVIPALIKKIILENDLIFNGTGLEKREFIYVEDVGEAIIHLIEKNQTGVFNVGTSKKTQISIRDLALMIQRLSTMTHKNIQFQVGQFDSGDNERYTDSSKLESTGFNNFTSLENGINKTIQYFRSL